MCAYCQIADWPRRWIPGPYERLPVGRPWPPPADNPPWKPAVNPWNQEMLDDLQDIIDKVKKMEEALGGCPCEQPEKMDYLKDIQDDLDKQRDDTASYG